MHGERRRAPRYRTKLTRRIAAGASGDFTVWVRRVLAILTGLGMTAIGHAISAPAVEPAASQAQAPAPTQAQPNFAAPAEKVKPAVFSVQVDPGGLTADLGVQAGDVILKGGERDIYTVSDPRQALADANARGRTKALALVRSGNSERYVALPAVAA